MTLGQQHPEQHFDQRQSLSARLPRLVHLMLGQAPERCLAQALITLLLLISPISFTTDTITNFVYECPVSSERSLKAGRSAVARRTVTLPSAALSTVSGASNVRTTYASYRTLPAKQVSTPLPSRASPV